MGWYSIMIYLIKKEIDKNFPILGRSKVMIGTDLRTKKKFAVKFVNNSSKSPQKEYNYLQMFSHRNTINALKVGTHRKMNYLVTEYMNQGNLWDFAKKNQIVLYAPSFRKNFRSEKFWRTIFLQSIQALRYLHGQGYAHLDVKPENFLINDEFTVKLIDFEFCFAMDTLFEDSRQFKQKWGTKGYYAPEIKYAPKEKEKRTSYDPTKCDVFSLAVMMLNLITGTNVFPNNSSTDEIYSQMKSSGGFEECWKYVRHPKLLSTEFKELIEKMMKYDANQRITIEEAENHSWFKGFPKSIRINQRREKVSNYEPRQKKIKKSNG